MVNGSSRAKAFTRVREVSNWTMKQARQRLGLKQEDMGRMVGIGSKVISHYESLRAWPRQEAAQRIAQALGVPVETIFPEWLAEFRFKSLPHSEEERCITFQEALSLGLLEREPVLLPGPNDDGILTQLVAEDVVASWLSSYPS